RVLAAELQARRLEVAAGELPHPNADSGGSGEADLVDEPLLERALEAGVCLLAVRENKVQDAVGHTTAAGEQLEQRVRHRRGVLRRLPDHRVAGEQSRDDVPRRYGDREVSRGHDRHDTDRIAVSEQLLVRHLARHGLAVEPSAFADEEVAGVDDLAYLAARLGDRLADLTGNQSGQGFGVVLDEAADAGDRTATH